MVNEATVIFPHQLFEDNSLLQKNRTVYLIEDERFFSDFNFHKHKLILHRASLCAYYDYIKDQGYSVRYVEFNQSKDFFKLLTHHHIKKIHYFDLVDTVLEKRLQSKSNEYAIVLCTYETPAFLSTQEWLNDYFGDKKKFFMASFYKDQRKRLGILIDNNGNPVGGSWSYDQQNRIKVPQSLDLPGLEPLKENSFVGEAKNYVDHNFAKNPGKSATFWIPTTHQESKQWLKSFFKNRFRNFGPYEDAIIADQTVLFHSILSPLLNTGLLTPDFVIEQTVLYITKHAIPLNSVEGFIRQIIGWREFIRAVYVFQGEQERTMNFWNHTKKLSSAFWKATTTIDPVDSSIKKVIHHAYVHHIERLMILGNFMLLCEIDPDQVYSWFMELFIDAYDWVMVPNVYGMSQYADGGLMATKPYISSSNYILKMSNFKKGPWCATWDALYWAFIYKHTHYFSSQGRLAVMNYRIKQMNPATLHNHLKSAKLFLDNL